MFGESYQEAAHIHIHLVFWLVMCYMAISCCLYHFVRFFLVCFCFIFKNDYKKSWKIYWIKWLFSVLHGRKPRKKTIWLFYLKWILCATFFFVQMRTKISIIIFFCADETFKTKKLVQQWYWQLEKHIQITKHTYTHIHNSPSQKWHIKNTTENQ